MISLKLTLRQDNVRDQKSWTRLTEHHLHHLQSEHPRGQSLARIRERNTFKSLLIHLLVLFDRGPQAGEQKT